VPMGRVKSVGFHQHVMRRRQKVTRMGVAGGTEEAAASAQSTRRVPRSRRTDAFDRPAVKLL